MPTTGQRPRPLAAPAQGHPGPPDPARMGTRVFSNPGALRKLGCRVVAMNLSAHL